MTIDIWFLFSIRNASNNEKKNLQVEEIIKRSTIDLIIAIMSFAENVYTYVVCTNAYVCV